MLQPPVPFLPFFFSSLSEFSLQLPAFSKSASALLQHTNSFPSSLTTPTHFLLPQLANHGIDLGGVCTPAPC
ncbi:hypothetical protein COCCADRAFT_82305 [Bipolaris zeicola 26-R-13]|uniref:Uncharacterized protein n=1 Tax=Cochliobolus carbonum (strain 26-R-13) TaxID=930089 RepID=W6YTT8_COCC2|nr:uncharacterized protein COCCADRAFT_82305 [Bipolaris zeicola 26-R-13]EUC38819.1 hypothetical protein COCCADRAFT_82305 [Bipolaris zeicola 26-R-13]